MSKDIPRSRENDYSNEIIERRQAFIQEQTGAELNHTRQFSFDPESMSGNIESIWGVSQIPIGLAGPLLVNGEHAKGEFYVPMATVEGTMLASYNRGMKVIRDSGGVTTTVCGEAMQRAPVFVFNNARQARDFSAWLDEKFPTIKAKAEETTSVGKLLEIEKYVAHNFCLDPLQLQHRRCSGAEHDQQGHLLRLRVGGRQLQQHVALHAIGKFRHREEGLLRQLPQGPGQARHRRIDHPRRGDAGAFAYYAQANVQRPGCGGARFVPHRLV